MTSVSKDTLVKLITWLMRLCVGAVFIFSGFVKAIDPWGTIYKVSDYLAALHFDVWPSLTVAGVFFLCAYEFLIGVFLFTGSYRRSSPWMAALLMLFMTPLTLWIAISNPVPDCGCFGDALILSNWATFWKNILLCCALIWLCKFNQRASCAVTPYLQWLEFAASAAFILIILYQGFENQPLLDFRQYPVGSKLVADNVADNEADDDAQYEFIYKKGEVFKSFSEDDELPDEADGWEFVERKEAAGFQEKRGKEAVGNSEKVSDFQIWNNANTSEVTDSVLRRESRYIIAVMPDLGKVSIATSWVLNAMNEWCLNRNIEMIAVVSATDAQLAEWEDLSMPDYPVYRAEDTQLKELVRGNPAVVYVDEGEIKWKNSLQALDADLFADGSKAKDATYFMPRLHEMLNKLIVIFLSITAVLVMLSLTTRLKYRQAHNLHPIKALKQHAHDAKRGEVSEQ